MSIKNKNGTINWEGNQHLIYMLFSIMKHYMNENNLTIMPCQTTDEIVIKVASNLSNITGENISPDVVSLQLWIHGDRPKYSKTNFRNLKIAIEMGVINEKNFNGIVLESRSRMERNKNKGIKTNET